MERIDRLETKVREMIAMVHSLREENSRLKSQVAEYENRLSGLSAEQGVIDDERNQLRDRIESMLADLEALEAAADTAGAPPVQDAPTAAGDTPADDAPPAESGGYTLEPQDSHEAGDTETADTGEAGALGIDLPEPDNQSSDTPENGSGGFDPFLAQEPEAAAPPDGSANDDEDEPPARPGSDPAHPVLPGFS